MGMGMGIHLLSPLPAHLTLTLTLTLTIYPSIADSRSGSPIPKRSAAQRRAHADGVPETERTHHEIREAAASL